MRVNDQIFRELTLPALLSKTATEGLCRCWFQSLRWPNGLANCKCGGDAYALRCRPGRFECKNCHHQFSLTANTPLHGSHLSLRIWLLAMYLVATSSKGVSARQLGRWLGIPYKSAWHLGHRIRSMMTPPLERLTGEVELDEQYGGGRARLLNNPEADGVFRQPKQPTGRGDYRPLMLTIAQRDGAVVAQTIASHSKRAISEALESVLHPDVVVFTDGLPAYQWLGQQYEHHTVIHSQHQYARTDEETGRRVHTNTCESYHSLFQRAVIGVYHFISGKHADRYLRQSSWYWQRKKTGPLQRMSDLFNGAPPLPYRSLVHG